MIKAAKVWKELVVVAENQVGALSRIAQVLAEQKVNIMAISAQATGGVGLINLVVEEPVKAKSALRRKGFSVYEDQVVLLGLDDQPGVLMKIAKRLAAKKVDILNVYGSSGSCCSCLLVLSVSDVAKTVSVLKK